MSREREIIYALQRRVLQLFKVFVYFCFSLFFFIPPFPPCTNCKQMVHVCVCVCRCHCTAVPMCVFFVSSKSLFTGWCVLYLVKKRARIVKDRAVALPRALPPRARHVSFNLLEIFFWEKKNLLMLFFFVFVFLKV